MMLIRSMVKPPRAWRVVCVVLAGTLETWSSALFAGTTLPVPCVGTSCGTKAPGFVTSGTATASQSGHSLTVNQTSSTATLNWSSFNISADGNVVFQQPSSTAIALNRIFDSNPSSIFGALTANGQIYLINANGFLFGRTSTVNVAGLLASSLNITDATFSGGLLSPSAAQQPSLVPFTDADNNPLPNTGAVVVQPGAQLVAADGGRLLLTAPSVQNGGNLSAPDGQIILAAGQTVYLQASGSTSLRGLVVAVDGAGAVANQTTGQLSASRGNITLTGLMVNQDGRISATTSVAANGSVVLEAANSPTFDSRGNLTAAQGGQLTIGPDSTIDILPELSDSATAVDAQTQLQSSVSITGQQVLMHGGTIDAPSGQLSVTAEANPSLGVQSGGNGESKIRIDSGTTIDLSGSNTDLPMAANLVTVQLRSNELANDPTQRNGALRGQTVVVDVRADGGEGTPIANVASAIAAVGKTIAQRTEAGGTASFISEGDVVFSSGASINVSGGATTYLGGTIQTTALVGANGQLYDIGSANPLQSYTGVVNPTLTQTYDKWGVQEVVPTPGLSHYESSYQQGAPAGSVQFAAPSLIVDGALLGTAVNGRYQRGAVGTVVNGAVPFGDAVPGATLIIGEPAGASISSSGQVDYLAPAVTVSTSITAIAVADTAALPPQILQLPAADITLDGFTNFQIFSNSTFSLRSGLPLQLPPGASFSVEAARVDIDSDITALGGNLKFASVFTLAEPDPNDPSLGPGNPRAGVAVGDGVALDVNGQWTNDSVVAGGLGSTPTLQSAGSITLQLTQPGSELVLGNGVSLLANGGAWVQANGSIADGAGGNITLDASPALSAVQFGQNLSALAFGVQTAAGGNFVLAAPRLEISQGAGSNWTTAQRIDDLSDPGSALTLFAPLFSSNGFSSISLTATGAAPGPTGMDLHTNVDDVLTVDANTNIQLLATSLQLNPGYQTMASGGEIGAFSQTVVLPPYTRPAVDVSLNVLRDANDFLLGATNYGAIDLRAGSTIAGDPGSTISITGEGSIVLAGTLRAPGGTVDVQTLSPGTGSIFDPGYLPEQAITLAATGVIDVSGGAVVLTPNTQGLLLGTVRSGGTVDLSAQRGALSLEAGSIIDFSGSNATLDVANPASIGGYTREVVASAGGSVTLASVESIDVSGTLKVNAGVGTTGLAAGGSLTVDLTRSDVIAGQPDPFGLPMEIDVIGDAANGAIAHRVDLVTLGVAELESSGIDSLTLNAGGQTQGLIAFDTASPLTLGRQITLNSQSLEVEGGFSATLAAPTVTVENLATQGPAASAQPSVYGDGILHVAAQQLIVAGNVTLQEIAATTLTSQGDVQLQGTASETGVETGSLTTAGNLTIDAARIYPDTFTSFSIVSNSLGNPASGTVTLGQTMPSPGAPLSAGGTVDISADSIVVAGSLYAPLGQVALTAAKSLTIADGGLVSVSGAGLEVPYGQTEENGAQWIYETPLGDVSVTGVPVKQVTLTAPNITVAGKATVDLTGGGNLYAYEWVPGTGGSSDSLAGSVAAGGVAGLYAILPSQRGLAAPYDPEESGSSPPQTVYLSGGGGIAAGFYSLLPPRYALEPGALLVKIEPSYVSATPGQIGTLPDGTAVVAGYITAGTTGLFAGSTQFEGFAIYPGSYGQQLAAYNISNASSYFSAIASLAGTGPVAQPADAGSLTFSVVQSLDNSFILDGSVLTAAAGGGRGALVNISAPNLEITSGTGAASTGSIAISGSVLQGWNASALTLGGSLASEVPTQSLLANGTAVATNVLNVAADTVTVDSGVQLTADQILVVALQSIDVKPGASLFSTSGKNGTALTTLPSSVMLTVDDGEVAGVAQAAPQAALLAVSDLALPVVVRSGPVAGATINLEPGSTLSSGGALAFDAPGAITLEGTIRGKGASWSLSSDSVAFVGSSSSADTLNIAGGIVAALQQAGAVQISSQGAIDIDAPVALGADAADAPPTLSSLTLLASSINGQALGNTTFGASRLMLGGVAMTAASPTLGSGTLAFVANTMTLGPETLAISGYANTLLQVGGAVDSAGVGGLSVAGDLTINAVETTPGVGASTTVAATGTLNLGAPTALRAGTTLPTLVGGALSLSGMDIIDAGVISASSGIVNLMAGGDLHLAGTAVIDTSGTQLLAVNRNAPTPGGTVSLSAGGNATLDAGSTISVAGEQAAPAGSIDILAGAAAALDGQLKGVAGVGGAGGSVSVDAGQLSGGLTPLAATLTAGGFTNSIDVRARSGDLDLAASGALTAASIVLSADTGAVNIGGNLTASSSAQRGFISLSAGTQIDLGATGQLHADGGTGTGGEIDLNAICATCAVTLTQGSVITASGTAGMGQLVLRAPALASTNDVAINVGNLGLGADVSKVGQVVVEPVMVFQTSAATVNTDLPTDIGLASSYLTAASPVIGARLTSPSATPIAVQAGVELQDPIAGDNLILNSTLDLSTYSNPTLSTGGTQSPQVINLNVRAVGSITIAADTAISDGLINDYNSGYIALSNLPSASLSFVAGADLGGANPLTTLRGSNAALTLMTSSNTVDGTTDGFGPAVIRTGTGDLNLAAAGDVIFGAGTSAYTGGEAPANVTGPVSAFGLNSAQELQNFGSNGGTVRVTAGADVVGSPVNAIVTSDNGDYGVTGWLLRQGNAQNPAQYGINFAAFDWNLGALGGGDVSVTAAGNVTNLSAAAAATLVSAANTVDNKATLYGAGGGLTISAGGDIGSAQVYVADGVGTLLAGGGLTATQSVPVTTNANQPPVGSSIALGDSRVAVWARTGIQIDAVYNPTFVPQLQGTSSQLSGQYFTYGTDSALSLSSTTGNVTLELSTGNGTMATLVGSKTIIADSAAFLILPSNLTMAALQGDVDFLGTANLFPSNSGQLDLFAGRDINGNGGGGVTLSDTNPALLPSVTQPQLLLTTAYTAVAGLSPFANVVHVDDPDPALVSAGRDIAQLSLSIPKAGEVVAGRDILDLEYSGQNIATNDTTLIAAGRDFIDQPGAGDASGIQVGGPGSVEVMTGRNLNLGFGDGIKTVGNLINPNLATSQGADVSVMVGYGTQAEDIAGFLSKVVAPSATYQGELVNYVEALTGTTGLMFANAETQFDSFTTAQRSAFVDNVFFNELLLSGRAANSGSGVGFTEGYDAIDALFPSSRSTPSPYSGDLTMTSSQIYTLSGGNISILVPGGQIGVGLANPPANITAKPASELGIVAEGTGDVSIYTTGDVNVDESRIFTLGGGNILIWSTLGSIDAGNGSKSSLSVPPPQVLVNANGTVSLDFGGSLASGSGIRTIQTNSAVPPGNVDLDAPVGTVDAGDAGIGASGNINIAAARVIGVDNINFGGTATGVPPEVGNLGVTLAGASAVAGSATQSAESSSLAASNAAKEVAPLAQTALNWLDVFVTGLGEENCKPDDIECLKRQRTASP